MNIPNRLTLIRIVLVPIIVLIYLFPYSHYGIDIKQFYIGSIRLSAINIIVTLLYLVAALTDALDGYIARKKGMITTLGKFLDPIADKMLTTALLVLFVSRGIVPVVPVVIMVMRDIIVDGCRMMASNNGKVIAAGMLGKAKTVLQMVAITLILLNNLPFELIDIPVSEIVLWFATFTSLLSGIQYFNQTKEDIFESM